MRIGTFDIETDGLLPEVSRVWCAVVKEHGEEGARIFTPVDIDKLCDYLDSFDILIGHNSIAFDFAVLKKLYGWEYKGIKIDTLLMSRMQRPLRRTPKGCPPRTGPHSVAAWGKRLGRDKVEYEEWDRFTPRMLHRCEEDVAIQVSIYHELLREGAGEGWTKAHKLNHKLHHFLQLQEEYGWLMDREWIEKCLNTLDRWMGRIDAVVAPHLPLLVDVRELKKEGEYGYVKKPFKKDGDYTAVVSRFLEGAHTVQEICGPFSRVEFRPVDLDKSIEVKSFLLEAGWEPEEWNTNNAGEKTSPKLSKDDEFRGIQGGLGKLIAKRVQIKQRQGIITGWEALIRPDGRISAQVAGVAATGRLRHKGIVNVPSPHSKAFFSRAMRRMFISRPGWVLVGADSKGNQVRQLAARMGDPEFTQAVLHGNSKDKTDLHSLNQQRSGAPSRSRAKNFFYGFIFGAGDAKIGKVVDGTAADGKALRARYLAELPLLKALIDRETEKWRESAQKWWNKKWGRMEYRNGYITGLDGRAILVDSEHKILCYLLQSDEAIQMAAAYVMFHKWMSEAGYVYGDVWGMLIWMHDEWQLECRPEVAEIASRLSCDAIKWAGEWFKIALPHEGEAKIGRSWLDTH